MWDKDGWLLDRLGNWRDNFTSLTERPALEGSARPLVWVGPEELPRESAWLGIRPPCLALGLGCNRGTPEQEIAELFRTVLSQNRLSPKAVALAASAEAKRDETGLLAFAGELGIKTVFYPSEQLNQVEVASAFGGRAAPHGD